MKSPFTESFYKVGPSVCKCPQPLFFRGKKNFLSFKYMLDYLIENKRNFLRYLESEIRNWWDTWDQNVIKLSFPISSTYCHYFYTLLIPSQDLETSCLTATIFIPSLAFSYTIYALSSPMSTNTQSHRIWSSIKLMHSPRALKSGRNNKLNIPHTKM